jgi:exodeoxyribonuclease VII large subunit
MVETREAEVLRARDHARRSLDHALAGAVTSTRALAAQVRALSPAATLDRGYAVVQTSDGRVVREATEVAAKDSLRIRVSRGELMATVLAVAPGRKRPAAADAEDA